MLATHCSWFQFVFFHVNSHFITTWVKRQTINKVKVKYNVCDEEQMKETMKIRWARHRHALVLPTLVQRISNCLRCVCKHVIRRRKNFCFLISLVEQWRLADHQPDTPSKKTIVTKFLLQIIRKCFILVRLSSVWLKWHRRRCFVETEIIAWSANSTSNKVKRTHKNTPNNCTMRGNGRIVGETFTVKTMLRLCWIWYGCGKKPVWFIRQADTTKL